AVDVDATASAPITSEVLAATKPDFVDEDHRAWRIPTLVAAATTGSTVEASSSTTGVAVKFALPTPDGFEPVLFLTRRGEVPDAAAMVAADNACGVASTQGNLGMLTGQAGAGPQGTTTQMTYSVSAETPSTASQATPDVVYVELWDNYGIYAGGPAHTGTFTI